MNHCTSIGTGVPKRWPLHALLLAVALGLLLSPALSPALSAEASESKPALSGVVNINTASREELELLPGVGEVRAVAIVAERKERGGFKTIEELLEVKGIGVAMLEQLRPHVTLTGQTTAQRL